MERFFSLGRRILVGSILLTLILGAGSIIGSHKNASLLSPTKETLPARTQQTPGIDTVWSEKAASGSSTMHQ